MRDIHNSSSGQVDIESGNIFLFKFAFQHSLNQSHSYGTLIYLNTKLEKRLENYWHEKKIVRHEKLLGLKKKLVSKPRGMKRNGVADIVLNIYLESGIQSKAGSCTKYCTIVEIIRKYVISVTK